MTDMWWEKRASLGLRNSQHFHVATVVWVAGLTWRADDFVTAQKLV
jgi:hypothetical protein